MPTVVPTLLQLAFPCFFPVSASNRCLISIRIQPSKALTSYLLHNSFLKPGTPKTARLDLLSPKTATLGRYLLRVALHENEKLAGDPHHFHNTYLDNNPPRSFFNLEDTTTINIALGGRLKHIEGLKD